MAGIGWQVKLYDPSLTRAIHEHLGDEQLIIRCNTNKLAVSFKRWVGEGRKKYNSMLLLYRTQSTHKKHNPTTNSVHKH